MFVYFDNVQKKKTLGSIGWQYLVDVEIPIKFAVQELGFVIQSKNNFYP